MKRVLTVTTALLITIGVAVPVLAAFPSEKQCEDSGAALAREQGEVSCVVENHVGKSDNSQTTTDATTGRRNIDNKQENECDGPGNSGEGSAHCR